MARILVTDPLDKSAVEALRKAGHQVDELKLSPEELLKAIPSYEALLVRSETKVTKAVLGVADKLKVVGRAGVGVDNIDVAAARERGVVVVNAPLAATNAVAELTLAHMLALARQLPRGDAGTRTGKWEKKSLMGIELSGRTLGLLGVGRIGGRVAELARAFGMRVVAYDPYVTPEKAREMGLEKLATPGEVADVADFVSVHVPLTPETRHMVNADLLARLKKGSFVLNVARGGIVDEKALQAAVASGHLGGAALDTFETEPVKETPLAAHVNVHMSPHLGASTHEAQQKAGMAVAEEVRKVLAGEAPQFKVA